MLVRVEAIIAAPIGAYIYACCCNISVLTWSRFLQTFGRQPSPSGVKQQEDALADGFNLKQKLLLEL